MRSKAIAIATALCLACAASVAQAAAPEYKPLHQFGVAVGDVVPLDGLVDPQGRAIEAARLRGKSVLINFYTKYCAPCIREVPKLNRVMARRQDIHVLAITPDTGAEAATYIKQYGLNWPVAANAGPLLSTRLHVGAYPAFALLDASGRLRATVQANQLGGEDGHATVEGIEAWLDAQQNRVSK